uniref:YiiM-like triple helical domain-containing protein n=1 Tax=Ralstonia solanacearum TaxID=305 RepID=A0A0S4VE33_RALSL|nr:protein of unknown function [Ralstonia solanacearum]
MLDTDALGDMLALPLTPSWRKLVENRLARGEVESWDKRIEGPARGPRAVSYTHLTLPTKA